MLVQEFYTTMNHHGETKILFLEKLQKKLGLIIRGKIKSIKLGNIQSKRDWGHAKDYVYAMWKMLQIKKADDFVIGTGKIHSVKDFIDTAFKRVNLNYRNYIKVDKRLFRPNDKIILRANFKKAHKVLKWKPKFHLSL